MQGTGGDDVPNGHGKRSRGSHKADEGADSELDGSTQGRSERVSMWHKGPISKSNLGTIRERLKCNRRERSREIK